MTSSEPIEDPLLTVVVVAYNEERGLRFTAVRLLAAFEQSGFPIELLLVNNGSTDGTARVIESLVETYPRCRALHVENNRGWGDGVYRGVMDAQAPWVATCTADTQVDAEDVVRLFDAALCAEGEVIAKARRRFRMDGLSRKFVSIAYNGLMWAVFPSIGSIDINGQPRVFRKRTFEALALEEREWFMEPEMLIKASHLGIPVIEFNVFSRSRDSGESAVNPLTCVHFVRKILRYRFSKRLDGWKDGVSAYRVQRSRSEHERLHPIEKAKRPRIAIVD